LDLDSNLQSKREYTNACPYLGLEADPETYLAWAANGNCCHRVHPPQPVSPEHQAVACLVDPASCPVYQAAVWDGPLPDNLRRHSKPAHLNPPGVPGRRSLVLWIVSVMLVIGLAIALWFLRPFPSLLYRTPTLTPTESPTPIPSPTLSPTITLTPSVTPTATFIPSPTPIITSSPTPMTGIEAVLGYGSNLRVAPVGSAAVLRFLDIGTPLVITGRNEDGLWGYVQLEDGTEGWIAMTQFEEGLDISNLPFGPSFVPLPTSTP
jgi:hypothetical protein